MLLKGVLLKTMHDEQYVYKTKPVKLLQDYKKRGQNLWQAFKSEMFDVIIYKGKRGIGGQVL